ncbi:MAG: hypothetical protein ACLQGP_39380 [Isosphaeraceae bacterium]
MARFFHRRARAAWLWSVAAGVVLMWASAHLAADSTNPKRTSTSAPVEQRVEHRVESGVDRRGAASLPPLESLAPSDPLPELPRELPVSLSVPPKAVARYAGKSIPGETIALQSAGIGGTDCRIRWVQVGGAPVHLDHPTATEAHFTVPDSEDPINFLLVVANGQGIDSSELSIPMKSIGGSGNSQALSADAGDDQLGIVGRQVTLNGFKSEPRGQIGYRWVQTGGPTVRLKLEDGYIYSFVPTVPGLYRFALVVGSGSRISQPDEVCVTVGSGTRGIVSRNEATPAESLPTQEIARAGMLALRLGPDVGEPLARTFDDTADRMDLYETYADAFAEMSRRLESVLPAGAAQRTHWNERLFQPLTARVIEVMRPEGLDLRTAEGPSLPLNATQRAALADQFHLMAEGIRSAAVSR